MMTKGTVLVCFQAATAGQQGNNLGSDESQIVLLEYALVDLASNKVIGLQEYLVKPTEDVLVGNFLSTEILAESRVTEHAVKLSGIPLKQAINQFENYLMTLGLLETTEIRLVTDGQLTIRQVIHPEACKKGIPLKEYYNSFHDIRKDVALFYGSDSPFTSISDMLIYLDIPHSGESDFYAYEFRDMVNIVQRLIADGYKFKNVETVNLSLEPGICSRDEEVDPNCVVRARGLPWQSSDKDIAKFFRGLNVSKGGVALCLSPMGRRNGEALVRFTCQEHRDMALKRHKHHIDSRYIEVYRASGEDFVSVAGGCNTDAQAFLTKGAHVIIRMRGLPYECTAKQVIEFFEGGEYPCSVMDGEEGVLFVKKPDGRSTGDAFVLFKDETDAPKALSRHRESIGTRYIELFRSTTAEVQQVLNRTTEYFEKTQQAAAAKIALQQQLNKVALASLPPFNQAKVALAAGMTAAAAGVTVSAAGQQPLCLPPPPMIQAPINIPPPPPPASALQTQMAAAAQMAQFLPQQFITSGTRYSDYPHFPQHIITSGIRKDCIRLRGLPYEAQVEHILEFLGEHAKSIIFQGVHMVYNSQGQPSGEAFIQMESESAAFLAAQGRHHRYMTFGKKQRYIEVFQCSGEDMSLVLSGGIPSTPQLSPVTKGVISPGSYPAGGCGGAATAAGGYCNPGAYCYPATTPTGANYVWWASPPVSPPPHLVPHHTLLVMARHDHYLDPQPWDLYGHSAAA